MTRTGHTARMPRINRSLTPAQEDDFFAGRPIRPVPLMRRPGFWLLFAGAVAVACIVSAWSGAAYYAANF